MTGPLVFTLRLSSVNVTTQFINVRHLSNGHGDTYILTTNIHRYSQVGESLLIKLVPER